MSYGLIYTIPFASLRNEACVVEIEKEDYTGGTTELTGAESPFEVDVDDNDFLYTPTRFSTARIRVVGSDYLQQLYSTSYQQYRVTFKRNGVVTWCGFVKPELYTQDYSSENFEMEIECMSAMSVLEFVNYKQSGTDGKEFVSLLDLIKKCVDSSRGQYSDIYIPKVYALSEADYNSSKSNVLEEMTVSEQDFFDEDDKPMKLKEVLEEICKLLNWTCCDWKGKLYFIDIDHSGSYYYYSGYPSWDIYMTVPQGAVSNVQKIGFAGSDNSLDRLNGWNKVTVRNSNYKIGAVTPEEDYEDLNFAVTTTTEDGNNVSHKVLCLPGIIEMRQYIEDVSADKLVPLTPEYVKQHKNKANSFLGALPARCCSYEMKQESGSWIPSITDYNYEDVIQVRSRNDGIPDSVYTSDKGAILSIKCQNTVYNGSGAFSLAGQIRLCQNPDMGYIGGAKDNLGYYSFSCSLRIGNLWYDGNRFIDKESKFALRFDRINKGDVWFRIKNTKTLNLPYKGMEGRIMELAGYFPIIGDAEFNLYNSTFLSNMGYYGFFLKDFKLNYQDADFEKTEDGDRHYENIVNEDYINELDEIEFKISSYNNDGACYSKVLLGGNYLTNNLYSAIAGKLIRPEEHLIQRIINRYSATRIKLTQVIKETPELTPLTKLSDNFMVGRIFMPIGGSIDYKMGQFKCVMVEV